MNVQRGFTWGSRNEIVLADILAQLLARAQPSWKAVWCLILLDASVYINFIFLLQKRGLVHSSVAPGQDINFLTLIAGWEFDEGIKSFKELCPGSLEEGRRNGRHKALPLMRQILLGLVWKIQSNIFLWRAFCLWRTDHFPKKKKLVSSIKREVNLHRDLPPAHTLLIKSFQWHLGC